MRSALWLLVTSVVSLRVLAVGSILLLFGASLPVYAQEQQAFIYEYDAAGNLISVRAAGNAGPPVISDISPSLINFDARTPITLTGQNLFLADVQAQLPGLVITDVVSISESVLTFNALAVTGSLGSRDINVTTLLGSATTSISIAERIPIVAVNPSPLLLEENTTRELTILLDAPYVGDVNMEVEVLDTSIATLPSGINGVLSVFIQSGETSFSFVVQAEAVGTTDIKLTQLDNIQVSNVTVVVAESVALPDGSMLVRAPMVSVYVDPFGRSPERIDARPVGVTRRVLVRAGQSINARPVGVTRRILVRAGQRIEAAPVGVEKQTE